MVAAALELALLWVLLASRDPRTVVVGSILLVLYAYYSATWAACERALRWLKAWADKNEPPPGAA